MHDRRETLCQDIPLRRRGPRIKRRPKTALIANAAHDTMVDRLSPEPDLATVPPASKKIAS